MFYSSHPPPPFFTPRSASPPVCVKALSHDFSVRNRPNYFTISAKVLDRTGDHPGALAELLKAFELPGVRPPSARGGADERKEEGGAGAVVVSLHDRSTVFVMLGEMHAKLGDLTKARCVLA